MCVCLPLSPIYTYILYSNHPHFYLSVTSYLGTGMCFTRNYSRSQGSTCYNVWPHPIYRDSSHYTELCTSTLCLLIHTFSHTHTHTYEHHPLTHTHTHIQTQTHNIYTHTHTHTTHSLIHTPPTHSYTHKHTHSYTHHPSLIHTHKVGHS